MTWFKNLRTITKLMLSFCLMSVCMAVVGYQGVNAANTINGMLNTLYERDMLGLSAIKEAGIDLARIGRDSRVAILSSDPEEVQRLTHTVDKEISDLDTQLAVAEKSLVTEEGKAQMVK